MENTSQTSFKTRVHDTIVKCAEAYNSFYVDREYLILSDAFKKESYYIINAEKNNYLHLTGVSTHLSALDFFNKCIDGTLSEDDFELKTHGKSEKESRGTIRQKVRNLPYITSVISDTCLVQEDFRRNSVVCSFASAMTKATLGFVSTSHNARPKSLLNGSVVDSEKSSAIKLAFSKQSGSDKFDTLLVGDIKILAENLSAVKSLISDTLLSEVNHYLESQTEEADTQGNLAQDQPNIDTKDDSC